MNIYLFCCCVSAYSQDGHGDENSDPEGKGGRNNLSFLSEKGSKDKTKDAETGSSNGETKDEKNKKMESTSKSKKLKKKKAEDDKYYATEGE